MRRTESWQNQGCSRLKRGSPRHLHSEGKIGDSCFQNVRNIMENRGTSVQPLLLGDSPRSGHIHRNRKGPAHFALVQRTDDSSLAYYPLRNIKSYVKFSRKKYISRSVMNAVSSLCVHFQLSSQLSLQ